ncbi:unnamed protein product, partial [Oikopleura dioica]
VELVVEVVVVSGNGQKVTASEVNSMSKKSQLHPVKSNKKPFEEKQLHLATP